jgi:hypothetical protein
MIARVFDVLFVLAFFVPPATILAGALLLALPSRTRRRAPRTAHVVGA